MTTRQATRRAALGLAATGTYQTPSVPGLERREAHFVRTVASRARNGWYKPTIAESITEGRKIVETFHYGSAVSLAYFDSLV